jgi:LysM repeat protein
MTTPNALKPRWPHTKAQGERLSALARRYGVSARNVAAWNGLTADAMLKPRQSVVLMLPNRPASKSAVPVAPPVAKKPATKSVAKR